MVSGPQDKRDLDPRTRAGWVEDSTDRGEYIYTVPGLRVMVADRDTALKSWPERFDVSVKGDIISVMTDRGIGSPRELQDFHCGTAIPMHFVAIVSEYGLDVLLPAADYALSELGWYL